MFTPVESDLRLEKVILLDLKTPGLEVTVAGEVQGSPAVTNTLFFAFEHLLAVTRVSIDDNPAITCSYEPRMALDSGKTHTYSSVIGVVPEGQMCRGFLCCLEREWAHPYRRYLHYDSWYDLNLGRQMYRMSEEDEYYTVSCALVLAPQ